MRTSQLTVKDNKITWKGGEVSLESGEKFVLARKDNVIFKVVQTDHSIVVKAYGMGRKDGGQEIASNEFENCKLIKLFMHGGAAAMVYAYTEKDGSVSYFQVDFTPEAKYAKMYALHRVDKNGKTIAFIDETVEEDEEDEDIEEEEDDAELDEEAADETDVEEEDDELEKDDEDDEDEGGEIVDVAVEPVPEKGADMVDTTDAFETVFEDEPLPEIEEPDIPDEAIVHTKDESVNEPTEKSAVNEAEDVAPAVIIEEKPVMPIFDEPIAAEGETPVISESVSIQSAAPSNFLFDEEPPIVEVEKRPVEAPASPEENPTSTKNSLSDSVKQSAAPVKRSSPSVSDILKSIEKNKRMQSENNGEN